MGRTYSTNLEEQKNISGDTLLIDGTYSLNYLMKKSPSGSVTQLLSTFKCTTEPELERFLKDVARGHESRDISRTYLEIENDKVLGFFTLATKCISIIDEKSLIDDIGGDLYRLMNVNNGIAQAYLIGQLARSDHVEKGLGKHMVMNALKILNGVKGYVGYRLVRLDCLDKLVPYYKDLGFMRIGKSKDNSLNHMTILI